jgi:hypothetical protein
MGCDRAPNADQVTASLPERDFLRLLWRPLWPICWSYRTKLIFPRGSGAVLDTWMTCNANLAGGHHQELAALKIVSVFCKHGIELFDLGLQFSSWEPKEDDAG